jgi:hypothetical protein
MGSSLTQPADRSSARRLFKYSATSAIVRMSGDASIGGNSLILSKLAKRGEILTAFENSDGFFGTHARGYLPASFINSPAAKWPSFGPFGAPLLPSPSCPTRRPLSRPTVDVRQRTVLRLVSRHGARHANASPLCLMADAPDTHPALPYGDAKQRNSV